MPWLMKDEEKLEDRLFFVHVPRCCGTSLIQHFQLPTKVPQSRKTYVGRFFFHYFFNHYKRLESQNFPLWNLETLAAFIVMAIGFYCCWLGSLFWAIGLVLLLPSFFYVFVNVLGTAAVLGRFPRARQFYLLMVEYGFCRVLESRDWCVGTNQKGLINHLTAAKLLQYGYVSQEEMETVCSIAIVRNPYSRMVSIYNYNRFGPHESFSQFIHSWYHNVIKAYRDRGEMEEWYTFCHAIPQFEYTHQDGKQIVRHVIKQEELKNLKKGANVNQKEVARSDSNSTDSTDSNSDATTSSSDSDADSGADLPPPVFRDDLPAQVKQALMEMPHANGRNTGKRRWYDYYDQETLDMVYEMYQKDFEVFDYSPILSQRPNLQPPKAYSIEQQV